MNKNNFFMSLFWFFYMAGLGSIFPFISLYLKNHLYLDGIQLGFALAIGPLLGILASPLWGYIADRTGKRKEILFIIVVGSAISYLYVSNVSIFIHLIVSLAILSVFTSPVMPIASALSFGILGKINSVKFGKIRAFGTIGYLIAVILVPQIIIVLGKTNQQTSSDLKTIFPIAAILCLISALPLLKIATNKGESSAKLKRKDIKTLLDLKSFKKLLIVSFFAFLILSSPISLFPLLIGEKGGDVQVIGLLWIPMLLLEIPLIFYASSFLKIIGAKNFIIIGILADSIRWTATSFISSLIGVFAFQILHGFVVVGLFIGMQIYVEKEIPLTLRSTGQALLGMTMGLGSVASYCWSGFILEHFSVATPFIISSCLAFILSVLTWKFLPEQKN